METNPETIKALNENKYALLNLAGKITKIPARFADADGRLNLEKVKLVLAKYQNVPDKAWF